MNLYISSYRLGNTPEKLVKLLSDNKKAAVIANAMDFLEKSERIKCVQQEITDLAKLGLNAEELDLRDYFNKSIKLDKKLKTYGLVWTRGGNVFILRRAMSQSGFDELLKKRVQDSKFVYAGYSAGVCVLSPSLHGYELIDEPNKIPEGYKTETIWDGIGIINFSLAPHYRSDHPESNSIEREILYFNQHNISYKALRDGEAIVMEPSL